MMMWEQREILAMVSTVRWYGRVLRREDGHVLRMALELCG